MLHKCSSLKIEKNLLTWRCEDDIDDVIKKNATMVWIRKHGTEDIN